MANAVAQACNGGPHWGPGADPLSGGQAGEDHQS